MRRAVLAATTAASRSSNSNVSTINVLRLLSPQAAAACLLEVQQIAASSRHISQLATSSSLQQIPHIPPAIAQSILNIPEHEIEQGLPEVTARLRPQSGTSYCTRLRKAGQTPSVLFSLPGNQSLSLTLDSKDAARLVRQYGRNGLQAQVLQLNIAKSPPSSSSSSSSSSSVPEQQQHVASVRVVTKEVHMNSVSLDIENFRFMFAPRDRLVTVEVPVKIWNADISPGVKAGGWLHVVNRTVPMLCYGWAIKPDIELDMRTMRVKDVIRFRDVPLPEGCQLKVKDPLQPVVRCAARVGGD